MAKSAKRRKGKISKNGRKPLQKSQEKWPVDELPTGS